MNTRLMGAVLVAYQEDNQSECIDVRFLNRVRVFHTEERWYQELRGHEGYVATLRLEVASRVHVRVRNYAHETEICEAGTRGRVTGHEDVCLFDVRERSGEDIKSHRLL